MVQNFFPVFMEVSVMSVCHDFNQEVLSIS